MMTVYDVAIIGAGPAGATFARELAKSGSKLKILLVNGTPNDGEKMCGGLLSPDAQEVFAKFNLTLPKDVLVDPQIFAVDTIDLETKQVRLYQRHYLNMNRGRFDAHLISLIPDTVTIINGKCEKIEESDNGYSLKVKTDNGSLVFQSRSIVGADGANSIVRRTFFKVKTPKYVSIQQWFECDNNDLPHYSCIFDKKTSDSCSWTIRKDKYYIFGGAFDAKNCREAFDEQKARFENFIGFDLGEPVKTDACLLSTPRKLGDIVLGKPNVYLIGEAAGFISSSSFEGISSAMISGKLLADAYAEAKNHKSIFKTYKHNSLKLRLKLYTKMKKRWVLCSPLLRYFIMKSGITSVEKYS